MLPIVTKLGFSTDDYPLTRSGLLKLYHDCTLYKGELEADRWSKENIDSFVDLIMDDSDRLNRRYFFASEAIKYLEPRFRKNEISKLWSPGIQYLVVRTLVYRADDRIDEEWIRTLSFDNTDLMDNYIEARRALRFMFKHKHARQDWDSYTNACEDTLHGLQDARNRYRHTRDGLAAKLRQRSVSINSKLPDDETLAPMRRDSQETAWTPSPAPTIDCAPTRPRSPSPASIRSVSPEPMALSKGKKAKRAVKTCVRKSLLFLLAQVKEDDKC